MNQHSKGIFTCWVPELQEVVRAANDRGVWNLWEQSLEWKVSVLLSYVARWVIVLVSFLPMLDISLYLWWDLELQCMPVSLYSGRARCAIAHLSAVKYLHFDRRKNASPLKLVGLASSADVSQSQPLPCYFCARTVPSYPGPQTQIFLQRHCYGCSSSQSCGSGLLASSCRGLCCKDEAVAQLECD